MRKQKTIGQLKKEADAVFSKYIRQRDKGCCITCGKQDDPKYMQAGHFVSRTYSLLRYDERNVNCQCQACNVWKRGNMDEYALRLELKHGRGILKALNDIKHKTRGLSRQELIDIISTYTKKLETKSPMAR
jgi:5-methylcytosine-specific restriction endonuclease McrA